LLFLLPSNPALR